HRSYDLSFKEGAVAVVRQTRKPVRQVARELGIPSATLACWVKDSRIKAGEAIDPNSEAAARIRQLEAEVAELREERDVLQRSVVLWVKDAMKKGRR
ncbi:MAG TPA: transposase, partial [Acidimicrobiales bacterium]|nr:transposase [Acidimicrobiales bacterium]